jgi:hypothetical protein
VEASATLWPGTADCRAQLKGKTIRAVDFDAENLPANTCESSETLALHNFGTGFALTKTYHSLGKRLPSNFLAFFNPKGEACCGPFY